MADKQRPGVMLYFELYPILRQMPPEEVYEIVMAIFTYARDGITPVFHSTALTYVWGFIQQSLQRDDQRYQRVVEQRRRAAEKRWDRERRTSGAADADACM